MSGLIALEPTGHVNEGEYVDAVTAARRAIDSMNIDWIPEKQAVQIRAKERSWRRDLRACGTRSSLLRARPPMETTLPTP